jgi:hypothetical protein
MVVVVPVAIGALQESNSRDTTVKASAFGLVALSKARDLLQGSDFVN